MHSLLTVLLALSTASASPEVDTKARVDSIFQEYDRSDSPGCALGVYRDGKIVYERGYGMANLELGVANSPQSVFDIGSTSKQFTAFSIHLLAREGRLSLDDDVRRWVPEVPSYGKTVTLRQLLHHTSGLRDYIELMALQGVVTEDLSTDEDALAILSRQKAGNFGPGEEHLYSNTGYFLLSVVVKRASGKSLRDFAAERIFGPLGMRHTQFNDSHTRILPNRATGYAKAEGGGFGIEMGDWEQTGDGAVQTTVEDLQLWDQNFYEPRVGDRRLLDEMQTVGVLNSGKKLDYASALRVAPYRGLPTVSHGGAWVGYRAQLLRFPQQRFSVACLCNLAQANPGRLALKVAEVYLGGLMAPEKAAAAPAKKAAAIPPAERQRLQGSYRNPCSGDIVTLVSTEKGLEGRTGGRRFTLVPAGPGRFGIEGLPGGQAVVEVAAGAPRGRPRLKVVTTYEDDETETENFEPVELWAPSPADLASFAGSYRSEELDTAWTLTAEKNGLVIHHRGIPAEPLTPTIADHFSLEGMSVVFLRDGSGRVTGFEIGEGRVRGIGFRRLS